jgi:Replication-relaxation
MLGSNGKGVVLQDRDRHLLRELAVMRVIDREQAKCVAGFGSTTRANSRLLALTQAGLLRRFFQGTTAGGKKALYALSPAGAKLVEIPFRGPRRGDGETLVADFFVVHQLQVNEIYCTLKYQPLPVQRATFGRWVSFHEPIESATSLIPDGYAEILTPQKPFAAFLEIDLGHESRPVWKRKVEEYLRYAVSGRFSERFGQPQFRVLTITTSDRRLASLRFVTASLTEKVFWFTTLHAIARDGFWSPIWLRPQGDGRQALL